MIRVIVNASPVIGLSKIGKLNLLWELFDEVYISEEAMKEVVAVSEVKSDGKEELERAVHNEKIIKYCVKDKAIIEKLYGKLHKGELETIIGGQELEVDFVIIDEIGARNLAKIFSLIPVGIIGILVMAKKAGLIAEIKPSIEKLVENNFRLSKQLIIEVLKEAGEN